MNQKKKVNLKLIDTQKNIKKNQSKPKLKICCVYCGQWFTLENKEKLILPKHKLPLNGKPPEDVAYCIGEGKKGQTKKELSRIK